jgi:hypothetical protein
VLVAMLISATAVVFFLVRSHVPHLRGTPHAIPPPSP